MPPSTAPRADLTEPTPAGWYRDPAGIGELRWWDGSTWTPGTFVDGEVVERPLPQWGEAPAQAEARDHSPVLPARAAAIGGIGIVVGLALSLGLSLFGALVGLSRIVRLVIGELGLWSGLLGACLVASRRYGSGRLRDDFGLRAQWSDLPRGAVISFIARYAAIIVALPFLLFSRRLVQPNDRLFHTFHGDTTAAIVLALIAVVGAPFIEELFFRGLLQRSFRSRLGLRGAVALQAGLFGLAHLNPLLGVANFSIVFALAAVGVVQGATAARYRRLGPAIVSHACFNLVAVLVALA